MAIHGYTQLYTAIHSYTLLYMDIHRYTWLQHAITCYTCYNMLYMDICGLQPHARELQAQVTLNVCVVGAAGKNVAGFLRVCVRQKVKRG